MLTGKRALITGSTSGIGLAIARAMRSEGAEVILNGFGDEAEIAKLCEERNVIRNQNFPGVVYRQMENVKSALIFASGRVVFTGAKTKDDIDKAYIELKKKMEKFKRIT